MTNKDKALERLSVLENEAKELRKIIEAGDTINPLDVTDYGTVSKILKLTDNCDTVSIFGFNEAETNVVKAIIKKMRVNKVLNDGWLPKRGERRHYPYYNLSSGFVFGDTYYVDSLAHAGSASRLCLKDEKTAIHFGKHFSDIDKAIIEF